ncbi:MAG: hypothetical protein CVV27_14775, partial [Candidatus Melainabacteria bacterium HGW-Melainabacteria-1]
IQTLWTLPLDTGSDEVTPDSELMLSEGKFRLQDPVRINWSGPDSLLLVDPFRLVEVKAGKVSQRLLLQALRRQAGQLNQAPEASFVARQQREAMIAGGSRTSIQKMLEKVTLFEAAPEEFYQDLIEQLQTQVFNRGDLIVRQGEPGSEMFLIRQGQIEVLDAQAKSVVARIGPGDVFGEVALMLGSPRNATVRAGSYAELFSLSQTALDALLPIYPDLRSRLLRLAQDRSTQQQLRSEADMSRLRTRMQSLRASESAAPAPRPQTQAGPPAGLKLGPLRFWARHTSSNQLAELDRAGTSQQLLEPGEMLLQPMAACASSQGLWVLDAGLDQLLLLDPENQQVLASYSSWGNEALNQPRALALGPEGLWIANTGASQLLLLSPDGELLNALACGRAPTALQVLPNQRLLIADQRMHTVSEMTYSGELCWSYGTPRRFGREENMLFAPEHSLRLDTGHTLIADTGNSRLIEVNAEGRIVWSLISGGAIRMTRPTFAERLPSGHTLIEHSNRSRWLEVSAQQLPVWRYALPIDGF